MNIILLESDEVSDGRAVLADRRAEHIVKVLRARNGDRLTVGIINGKTGYGIIKEITRGRPNRVEIGVILDKFPAPPAPVDVLLALPRPIVFKRVISQLAALGVHQVYVVNAAKVEKSYWESSLLVDRGWERYVREGLEQAVDTRLVDFNFHRGFKPFMQEVLPGLRGAYRRMLVAHPRGETALRPLLGGGQGRVLVAVGPEGGWNDYELETMREAGFVCFSLGPRILRVETAVTAAHTAVSLLLAGL